MVDYQVDISPSTTMLIRDTGSWIEFWFRTGVDTWNNQQQWSYFANGVGSGNQTFRLLRGGYWQKFGEVYITFDQDVSFSVYDSGINFPSYTFTQHITRSTVPQPPILTAAYPISTTAFHVTFIDGNDGGSSITGREIGYGTSSNGPVYTIPSDGSTDILGFTTGQHFYFWARTQNALGWSAWSNRLEASTWLAPRTPGLPFVSDKTQVSVTVQYIFAVGSNDPPILERQIGYGTDSSAPTDFSSDIVDGADYIHLTDLDPGGTYYVWGRSRNAAGWSAWSPRLQIVLIAGARILVGTEWKRAVPYVNVGGVWKVARPMVKNNGIWKGTSI